MNRRAPWWLWLTMAVTLAPWRSACAQVRRPIELLDQDEPQDVYLPPSAPTLDQMVNEGGVHFSLDTSYLSTYIFRGVDQSTPPKRNEQALQFDGRLTFDLGKLPHPFIGLFSNVFNNDPVSRFEEVRPKFGMDWELRPITVSAGFNSYIFPNREGKDTQEVWTSVRVDDSRLFHTEKPVFAPYVYGAYDYDKYKGFYIEAGIRHDFDIGDMGLTLSPTADFAYVAHDSYFRNIDRPNNQTTGFQHYDAGLEVTYDLDRLIGIPRRYGEWNLKGYLFYTGPVSSGLAADSRIWGGVGLDFQY